MLVIGTFIENVPMTGAMCHIKQSKYSDSPFYIEEKVFFLISKYKGKMVIVTAT
jgi:hypothetical protein